MHTLWKDPRVSLWLLRPRKIENRINKNIWFPKYILENAYLLDKMDYEKLVSGRMMIIAERIGKGEVYVHKGFEGLLFQIYN